MQRLSHTPEEEEKRTVSGTPPETRAPPAPFAEPLVTQVRSASRVSRLSRHLEENERRQKRAIWTGYILSAWVSGLGAWLIMAHPGSAYSQYSFALLVLVPLLGGVIQALSLRGMYTSSGERAIYSLFNTIVSCIGAAIFLREGAVCLVMAFPLLWLMYYVGVTIGCLIFERGPRPLQVSVVPMVLFAMVWDVTHPTVYSGMTTTRLRVNASPSAVGKYIVAFPKIDTPPTFWLCYFGLPYPEQTTAERPTVGAKRECWLSGNLVVREKITEYSPGRSVTFTVTEQPRDPEIAGHFDLQQGRITVADNGDGTSTLIGTSWYRLRVAPSWYFGPWADHLIHSVHERVFQHINRLAERDTPAVIR